MGTRVGLFTRLLLLGCFVLCSAFNLSLVAQSDYEWRFFTTLVHGRQQHDAVWVGKSRVLVIGGKINGVGQMNGTPTTSCEIIDLVTASSVEVQPMRVPRAEHTVLVNPVDSTVYVIGGVITQDFYGEVTKSIEKYDVASDTWTVVGQLNEGRRQHVSYWLNSHEIMTVGGREQSLTVLSSAEIFDVQTGQSRNVASYPVQISTGSVVSSGLYQGTVMGGRAGGPNSDRTSYGYRYDQPRDRWAMALDINKAINRPTVIGLWGAGAIICGGAQGEQPFDAIEHVWYADGVVSEVIGFMQNGRQWHAAAQVNSDTVIVGGGFDDGIIVRNSCDWIDVSTGTVDPGPEMNVSRAYPLFVSVPQEFDGEQPILGTVLAIGGHRDDGILDPRVEILVRTCTGELDLLTSDVPKRLSGSAKDLGSSILLTDTVTFSRGAAWIQRRTSVASGFSTTFTFRLSDGFDHALADGGSPGADGVALVIQNEYPGGVGESGRGIGYDGLPHGLAVEFDAYLNAAFGDVSGSHVAVQVGDGRKLTGNHYPPFVKGMTYDGVPDFKADGTVYHAKVEYNGSVLKVWCDLTGTFTQPVLQVPIDISSELGLGQEGRAWMGITSATGFASQRHEIMSWSIGSCDPILVGVDDDRDGIPTPAVQERIRIVPHPSRDIAQLELTSVHEAATVVISDLQGAEQLRFTVDAGDQTATLPVDRFQSGTYVVRVITQHEVLSLLWNVLH